MFSGDFINESKQLINGIVAQAENFKAVIESLQNLILHQFGQNGLYATYILLAALILFVTAKLLKLVYSTAKYLVVPSLALALAGSMFFPYSFTSLLPVTVSVCSVVLLFKG